MGKVTLAFLVLLMLPFQPAVLTSAIVHHYFTQEMVSNIQEKINVGCTQLEPSARDNTACATLCAIDNACVGVSVDDTSQCHLHRQCPSQTSHGRITNSNGHRYMVKSGSPLLCFHEGQWNHADKRCDCKYGWTGKHCDTMATSCDELKTAGYPIGNHKVNLDIYNDVTSPMWVMCATRAYDGKFYVLVTKNTGVGSYNKTYNEFVEGFGTTAEGMWIGLENLYQLSQAGYTEFYTDIYFSASGVPIVINGLHAITLASGQDGYEVTTLWESFGSNNAISASHCFFNLKEAPFCAWDADNDNDGLKNCAAEAGTGWWFIWCNSACNLLGRWPGPNTDASSEDIMKIPGIDLGSIQPDSVEILWYIKK